MILRTRNVIGIGLSFAVTLALTAVVAQSEYTLVRLDTVGTALAINNRGQVVGHHTGEDRLTAPFLWTNGTLITLEKFPGGEAAGASDINNRGQIVGTGDIDQSGLGIRAALWEKANGEPINLGTLPGGDCSEALGINDRGVVVGLANLRPVMWVNREIVDLGTPAGYMGGVALDINERGQVVGYITPDAVQTALRSGTMAT